MRTLPGHRATIGRLLLVAGTSLASACPDRITTADPTVTLLTPQVWAGDTVRLRVNPVPPVLWLTIDGDSVPVAAMDDSTIAAIAPQRSGSFEVVLYVPSRVGEPLPPLRIYGYLDTRPGPRMTGYPQPVTYGAPLPIVVVNGDSSLVRVDLRTGSVTGFPGPIHRPWCSRGPGPTNWPGVFILSEDDAAMWSCIHSTWQLWPTPVRIDSGVPRRCESAPG